MSDAENPGKPRPHRATSQGFRAQRDAAVAAALRANLRRRKAAEKPDVTPETGDHENAQTDESGNP